MPVQKLNIIQNDPANNGDLAIEKKPDPGPFSILKCKCPRCRQGDMFQTKNPYQLKSFMKMYENCPVCKQPFDLEVGFYYGSAYVSYGLTVALSVVTFILWWVTIGFSLEDNRVFYWLIVNAVLLIAMQPYLMRLARTIWLMFFVSYDKHWDQHEPEQPERVNESQKNAW